MTARIYRSTDYNAPQVNGAPTDLSGLLQACLVNGYGDQNVSITRSGNVATVTTPQPHGLVKTAKVRIAGANQPQYNGEFSVAVTGANTYTYPVTGSPASPATGTVTARLDGAGWSNPYTGGTYSEIRAFRQGTPSNGFYLRVDGSNGVAPYSRVVGYESMSDVNTGANAFPTEAQVAGGLYMQTMSGSGASRAWVVAATERFVFCHINANATAGSPQGQCLVFGDIKSLKPGDSFNTMLIASTNNAGNSNQIYQIMSNLTTAQAGHYIARAHNQAGASLQVGKIGAYTKSGATIGAGLMPYPNGPDNALHISNFEITESGNLRGSLPGLWYPLHNKPLAHLDTFDGVGDLAGKTFQALNIYSAAQMLVEISDTW